MHDRCKLHAVIMLLKWITSGSGKLKLKRSIHVKCITFGFFHFSTTSFDVFYWGFMLLGNVKQSIIRKWKERHMMDGTWWLLEMFWVYPLTLVRNTLQRYIWLFFYAPWVTRWCVFPNVRTAAWFILRLTNTHGGLKWLIGSDRINCD